MRTYNNDSVKWTRVQPDVTSLLAMLQGFTWCVISRLQSGRHTREELMTTMNFNDTPYFAIGEAIIDALAEANIVRLRDEHFSISPHLRYGGEVGYDVYE